ncbi:MAG: hypothetical protein PVH68_13695 [Armatimonadota bacterium]
MRRQITFTDVAKIGCLLGLIGFCIFGVAAILRQARESRQAGTCTSNMILVYRGLRVYAIRHGGVLPDAERWADALVEEKLIPGEQVLHCPGTDGRYGYAMNSQFSGVELERIADPSEHVLVFESDSGLRNAHDLLESIPDSPRHPGGSNYIFVDGHGGRLEEVPEVGDANLLPEDTAAGEESTDGG